MFQNIRQRAASEKGFTLIELLVVILIIGILAAIALPAFLNQREKAQDSEAKSNVRTAQTAMETWFTDHETYDGATPGELEKLEPALKNANVLATVPTATSGYTVTVTSKSNRGTTFTVRNVDGTVTRLCSQPGKGGCKVAVAPSLNQW